MRPFAFQAQEGSSSFRDSGIPCSLIYRSMARVDSQLATAFGLAAVFASRSARAFCSAMRSKSLSVNRLVLFSDICLLQYRRAVLYPVRPLSS